MPRTTVAGHPLHPQLVGLPIGMLPFSWAMDILHAVTGKRSFAQAAHYALIGTAATGLTAGVAGALDYLAIPSRTQEKRLGNIHALLNLGLIGVTLLNLRLRREGVPRSKAGAVALGALASGGLLMSSWYGGHLVYEYGVRVKGMQELAHAPEIKVDSDAAIQHGLDRIAEAMPSAGPQERTA